jgi:glycosyltransferase involved in cell wall biosynthesis
MDYMPNVDAAVYFYNEVLPKIRERFPAARFRIVGRAPSPKLQATCRDAEITGYVPDIRPYLWSSAVYVAPLRISYGVPNKVLEAMAAGVPVVATSRAVQGIRVEKGKDVLVADTPGEMAEKIVSLLENSALREEMSRRAKEYVLKEHDWDATGHKLKDIFSEIEAE